MPALPQEVLSERLVNDSSGATYGVASLVFPFYWVVAPTAGLPNTLRIATGLEPLSLVPTATEGREAERQAKEAERQAKEAAEARVAALEALLRSKG